MPRIKISRKVEPDPSWSVTDRIEERIKKDEVVPLISNRVSNDLVLGGHARLGQAYADYIRYPLRDAPDALKDRHDLLRMMQFKAITDERMADSWELGRDYVNFVKNRLCDIAEADQVSQDLLDEVVAEFDDISFSEMAARLGYPRFDSQVRDPLLVLADLPLSVFVTTSYHGFLEAALKRAGKTPRIAFCRWRSGGDKTSSILDGDYEPSRAEPLVYHLYGFDEYPDSMVLTEDDYVEFLVAIARDANQPRIDPIHAYVRRVMSSRSLVLLGYDLYSWDFRALFWGLIKPRSQDVLGFSIQLEPEAVEKTYLSKYLQNANFEVYWGDVPQFTRELYQALRT
jgi:hypothetical protein